MEIPLAAYKKTGVSRFDGNPFIEALPRLEATKANFLTNLAHYPPKPTTNTRRGGQVARTMELSILGDIVHPYPEYQNAGIALATILRESYVARNPLTAQDRQRRHALATSNMDGLPFPASWRSTAKGHFIMAISGMGKTTFTRAFLLRYPQVIQHREYCGQPLRCYQITYIVLRTPHDATLRSLCIQFFTEIDKLLGTNYTRRAIALRQIARMVQLMNEVATAVSLGFLVIDEVQNLRSARSMNAEVVLNLFSEIIERLGISLLVLATPAVQAVIESSVRNVRKLASYGQTVFTPMKRRDALWRDFCETCWDYTFVRNKGQLTSEICDAWHKASGGNTAFATLTFMLAQRNEIGEREIVDTVALQRVAATDLAFLQPAIVAINSGSPAKLRAFDDLLFSPRYQALRGLMGVADDKASRVTEFDDVPQEPTAEQLQRGARRKKVVPASVKAFVREDPLRR